MRQDKEVNVNWLRINVPQVVVSFVSIISCTVAIMWFLSGLFGRVDALENNGKTRAAVVDNTLSGIKDQLTDLNTMPLRMNLAEKNISQTNSRFDQFLTTFGLKIDAMGDKVNALGTKVEVLSNKIEQALPEKKAIFR